MDSIPTFNIGLGFRFGNTSYGLHQNKVKLPIHEVLLVGILKDELQSILLVAGKEL